MRILITADLHYDIARSRRPTRDLARRACRIGGDVLVLVGDSAGKDPGILTECLELFSAFRGRKLLVAGNHCLWCREGENSIWRHEQLLPAVAAESGFHMLDHQPVILARVALVGSVGWYDYSFRDPSLGIPLAFYRAKMAPGVAAYLGRRELVEAHSGALRQRHLAMGSRWMDGEHVRLGMDDETFTGVLADRLARQLDEVSPKARRILVFLHHVPFRRLVPQDRPDRFAFAAAYMGAERFGNVLLARGKVTHVYCGHSHWPARHKIAHVSATNVGSTYTEKRMEVLEIQTARLGRSKR
jgi:predicted phosphohydrolase